MTLAISPPIAPMLARLTRELPSGELTYEPKWDGFRCLAWVEGEAVDLRSRHDRPLARYFPEVVEALETLFADTDGAVLDGELLIRGRLARQAGAADVTTAPFELLMRRLHPAASLVERLSRETPARYVAFDLLAIGATDLRDRAFVERRSLLERLLPAAGDASDAATISITPATRDAAVAEGWLEGSGGAGIDGVVAKADDLRYEAGRRAMTKVKRLRSADCVVAGVRPFDDGTISSLLLGLYDARDELRHVGVVTQLPRADRRSLVTDLAPLQVPLAEHPWRNGFAIGRSPLGRLKGSAARWTPDMEHDWVPLRPERVVEVGFDQVDVDRFRHPATLIRWRPDRTAESCRLDQLAPLPVAGATTR